MAKDGLIVGEVQLTSDSGFVIREIVDKLWTSISPRRGPLGPNPSHYPKPPYFITIETLQKLEIHHPEDLLIAFTMTEDQEFQFSVRVHDAKEVVFATTPQTVKAKPGHRVTLALNSDAVQDIGQHFKKGNALSLWAVSFTAPALLEFSVRNKMNQPL